MMEGDKENDCFEPLVVAAPPAGHLKQRLDNIFTEVTNNLPSIDLEFSDLSSDDDDVPIFHAPVGSAPPMPDAETDTDLGDVTVSLVDEVEYADRLDHILSEIPVGVLGPTLTDTRCVGITKEARKAKVGETEKETDTLANDRGGSSMEPEVNRRSRRHSNRTTLSARVRRAHTRQSQENAKAIASRFMPAEPPNLAMNNIDLDALFNTTGGVSCASPAADCAYLEDALADNTTRTIAAEHGDGLSLIQRLAQISLSENERNQHDVDPQTGAIQRKTKCGTELKQRKTAENLYKAHNKLNCMGTNTQDLPNRPQVHATPKVPEERDTIHIDLRGFENKKPTKPEGFDSVRRILQISHDETSDGSSDDDDDAEMWHEQRKRIKDSLRTTGALPPEYRKQTPSKARNVSTSATTRRLHPRVSDRPGPKASVSSETETQELGSREVGGEEGGKEEGEECGSSWAVAAKVDSHAEETQTEREQQRRREEARKLLERRQKEHQSRIRLGLQLDAMRPTVSNTGREARVEAVPTLFDTEVSYEPEIEALPPHLPADSECILLTVHLSCNGEITTHTSGGGSAGSIDDRGNLSGSYTTLLSWLLSLVPKHSTHTHDPHECISGPSTPFHVIGLQQMYLDEQLCLFIAVTPKVDAAQDSAKLKKGKTKDDSTAFQNVLAKFLSTNTLHTVCPWLEAPISPDIGLDRMAQQSVEQQSASVYKPSLSNITTRPLSSFVHVIPGAASAVRVLGLPVGFFWQMIEGDDVEIVQDVCDDSVDYNMQTTMSLIDGEVYRDPSAMVGILNRVRQEGLDLAGIRLLFHRTNVAGISRTAMGSERIDGNRPILAMAVRGRCARQIWLDAVGPADPVLARITDPDSLMALHGGQTREESLLYCPHSPTRATAELCRWFGGRVPASGVVNTGSSLNTKRSKKESTDILGHRPPAVLTVMLPSDVFVLLSPLAPGRCTGVLLATAQGRGYRLSGFRQLRLSRKKCTLLGMAGDQAGTFTGSDCSGTRHPSDTTHESQQARPCMVMQLRRENALHHIASLIESFTVELSLHNMLSAVQANCMDPVKSSLLFHAVNFSEPVLTTLGGDFTQVPSVDLGSSPGYIAPKLYTNPELEQFVVVTFVGHEQLKTFGESLRSLQNMTPHSSDQLPTSARDGFELLGLKWLPRLTSHQARQLTPFEVGDKEWKSSVHTLTAEPAAVVLLRGVDAFHRAHSFVASLHTGQGDTTGLHHKDFPCLVSATPDITYQQAMVFFHKRELYADPSARWLLSYLPPCHVIPQTSSARSKRSPGQRPEGELTASCWPSEESIFDSMLRGPRPLCTLLLVKPDVVKQGLSKLLRRLAQEGFVVVAMRLESLSEDLASKVVPEEDKQQDEELRRSHVCHMTSGLSLLLIVQRENAVKKLLDLLGPEDPRMATVKNSGFWRAIFGRDGVANGLYASRSYAAAVDDQKLFFPAGLCCKETPDLKADMITCQAVDSTTDMAANRKLHVVTTKDSIGHGQPESGSSNTSTDGEARATTGALGYLTETTCVLLTPALLQPLGGGKGRHFPYIDIIESLLKNRFELVGCRMLWLTKEQAEQCLHLYDAGSFSLVPQLTSGPSIIVALQRDNAIVLFDALLGSVYDKESLYFKYSGSMMRSKDAKQAMNQLCFLFDELTPGAHAQIVAE